MNHMCVHENKSCPRCNKSFECKSGSILQCQCYGAPLKDDLRKWLMERYEDCLCRQCLNDLAIDVHFLADKIQGK